MTWLLTLPETSTRSGPCSLLLCLSELGLGCESRKFVSASRRMAWHKSTRRSLLARRGSFLRALCRIWSCCTERPLVVGIRRWCHDTGSGATRYAAHR